jgi:hypothetical protein
MNDFKIKAEWSLDSIKKETPTIFDHISNFLYWKIFHKLDIWSKPRNPSWYDRIFLGKILHIKSSFKVFQDQQIKRMSKEIVTEIDKEIFENMKIELKSTNTKKGIIK